MNRFYAKQKVHKINNFTNIAEKQWKNSKLNKVYTVKHSAENVYLYNVEDVVFAPDGKPTISPPEIKSDWVNSHIKPIEEY